MSFKKEKLSVKALDNFVKKYMVTTDPQKGCLPYIMQNGQKVFLSREKINNDEENCNNHFKYLLGQTLPYHQPKDLKHINYHLRDFIFIINEKGQQVPWTRDKKVMAQFTQVTNFLGYLMTARYRKTRS